MLKSNPLFKFVLAGLVLTLFYGCDSDDSLPSVDSTPEFAAIESEISSLPGEIVTFKATINDPAGVRSVNLKYEQWFLDKTILKDSLPQSYELNYNFEVPNSEQEGSTHIVTITAENAGGVITTQNVTVTLDADIEVPEITINSPMDQSTFLVSDGDEIVFDITVADESLETFSISSDLLNENIDISGTSYNYTGSLDVNDPGNYAFTISSSDTSGNMSTTIVNVNIISELVFSTMYLTDVADTESLSTDLFGVPAITEDSPEASEVGYVFTGKYYAAEANTEVRFIPLKTAFNPYTFGADPDNPGSLMLGDSPDVPGIVLSDVGYYEITINLIDFTYTVTPYTPTDTAFDQVYIIGRGITVGNTSTCESNANGSTLCWNFGSGKPFNQDPNNPYRWTLELTLEDQPDDEGENGFILNANPAGWSPFWRFDNGEEPNATVPNGGDNYTFDSSDFGNYLFVFDTHLNRLVGYSM